MVTYDLRMCKYVDKVIQMVDGKIARIITERDEINLLAGTSEFDRLDKPVIAKQDERIPLVTPPLSNSVPVFMGAD